MGAVKKHLQASLWKIQRRKQRKIMNNKISFYLVLYLKNCYLERYESPNIQYFFPK